MFIFCLSDRVWPNCGQEDPIRKWQPAAGATASAAAAAATTGSEPHPGSNGRQNFYLAYFSPSYLISIEFFQDQVEDAAKNNGVEYIVGEISQQVNFDKFDRIFKVCNKKRAIFSSAKQFMCRRFL